MLMKQGYFIETDIKARKAVRCRFTGLIGATMSGHKFKPFIIGKDEIPRAFKEDTIDSQETLDSEDEK